mmetsp:Transcript_42638/g.110202  ORF Transcript_42638/g.110202 Transcript_42638/m.110202 type:complete len:247 (+) Transcript_42638:961-1701(+)
MTSSERFECRTPRRRSTSSRLCSERAPSRISISKCFAALIAAEVATLASVTLPSAKSCWECALAACTASQLGTSSAWLLTLSSQAAAWSSALTCCTSSTTSPAPNSPSAVSTMRSPSCRRTSGPGAPAATGSAAAPRAGYPPCSTILSRVSECSSMYSPCVVGSGPGAAASAASDASGVGVTVSCCCCCSSSSSSGSPGFLSGRWTMTGSVPFPNHACHPVFGTPRHSSTLRLGRYLCRKSVLPIL